VEAGVAVPYALQAENNFGPADVGRAPEQIMDAEAKPGDGFAAVDREQQREAELLAPRVEAAHQVDRFAFGVRVAGMEFVERVAEHKPVVAGSKNSLDSSTWRWSESSSRPSGRRM
jgi:hypothetical protein